MWRHICTMRHVSILKNKAALLTSGGKRFRLNSDMSFHTKIDSLQLHVMGETGTT